MLSAKRKGHSLYLYLPQWKTTKCTPTFVPSCSPVHPPPHLWDRPKAQPAWQRSWPDQNGPAPSPLQGPHPACHGQHPAGSDGNTPLPGEEGQGPGSGQGVAAGRLRAGRAALQSILGGHGGLQHHTGHSVVSVAGRLSVLSVLRWTHALRVEQRIEKGQNYRLHALCSSVDTWRHSHSNGRGNGFL